MHRAIALVILLACLGMSTPSSACELCGTPEDLLNGAPENLLCGCVEPHGLLDIYVEGAEGELEAFRTQGGGWTNTASGPANPFQPAKVTWSIVPNGTAMPSGLGEVPSASNLINFLDGIHHGGLSPGGTDLTQRAWFQLFNSSFERWDALSGLTVTYEPRDDAATVSAGNVGILNRRGDHRISGHSIDGQISPTYLAYNYFPNNSDMVIDTDEINRWGNPEGNYLRFRNMLTHEFGHGLGLQHVTSANAQFLMEPFLAVDFDGPQLDDILGIQRLYGDVNESGTTNNTYLNATTLGMLMPAQSLTVGSDAADVAVAYDEVDFVSIHKSTDVDYFRFSILKPTIVDVTVIPLGPTYSEGPQGGSESSFNTAMQSDLKLTLWKSDGITPLESVNVGGLGQAEIISNALLLEPGNYYVSVAGTQDAAQFYQLSVANIVSLPEPATLAMMVLCCCAVVLRRQPAR